MSLVIAQVLVPPLRKLEVYIFERLSLESTTFRFQNMLLLPTT